ncbi:MAG: hypothetical protein ACREO1_09440 [Arenimonas sp.]
MKANLISVAIVVTALFANSTLQAKTEKSTSASKALIERSAIIIPKNVKKYQLVNFDFDMKNKSSGVSIRYVSSEYPDIAVDFFVYPIGKGPNDEILKFGMQEFTEGLRQAGDMGVFEKLVLQPEQKLLLDGEKICVVPVTEKSAAASSSAAKQEDKDIVLESLKKSRQLHGRKVSIAHFQKNVPMQSLGYIFYRQLYLTKVRVTASADAMSSEEFNTMADQAASQIVGAIEARNIGSCSNPQISISVDDSKDSNALMQQIMDGVSGNVANNCVSDLALGKIAKSEFEVVMIEYTPEDWGN